MHGGGWVRARIPARRSSVAHDGRASRSRLWSSRSRPIPFVGQLVLCPRLLGLRSRRATRLLKAAQGKSERVGRLLKMHANKREEIDHVFAGGYCGGGRALKNSVTTGDTICSTPSTPIVLEAMSFPGAGDRGLDRASGRRTTRRSSRWRSAKLMQEDPTFQVRYGTGDRADADLGHGRVASRDHYRSSAARVRRAGEHRPSAGRLPGDHHSCRPRARGASCVRPVVAVSTVIARSSDQARPILVAPIWFLRTRSVGGSIRPRVHSSPVEQGIRECARDRAVGGVSDDEAIEVDL